MWFGGEVKMRTFFVSLIVTGAICLCPFAFSYAMSEAATPDQVYHPQVKEASGPVTVKGVKYAVWEPVQAGMLLLGGDVLRTEKGGHAVIEFASGTVELYETTVMVIPSIGVPNRKKDITEVNVEKGNTLFDINPLGVERGFEFRTRNVQGGVKGTMFTVSYVDDGTSVNVYRGVVQVSDLQGTERTVVNLNAGQSLRVGSEADFTQVKDFDPDQALTDYTYNIPPGLDEKGLPADYNANTDNNGVRDRGHGIGRVKEDKDKDK